VVFIKNDIAQNVGACLAISGLEDYTEPTY